MALSRKSGAYGKNIFIYFNCELIKYKLKEIKELNDIANSVLKTSGMSTIISHAYQKILWEPIATCFIATKISLNIG